MTRAPGELLREVATALACFASTKHAQAHVQRNPAIKAEMLAEVDRIEALKREVRDAAQAQAGAGVWLICWEPGDPYESGGVEDGAWRTEAEAEIVRARLEAEERASWAAYPGYGVKTYTLEFRPFALAQAQAGAGSEGQGEGA